MHSPRIDLLIQPQVRLRLESISKTEVLEEQADRGHLNERQKVLRMILPADQKPVLPLHPTEEPLNFTSIMLHDTQSSDPKQPHHVFEISSSKMSIPGSSATYRFGPPR